MENLKEEIERKATALVEMKSIAEVGINDVQMSIDKNKRKLVESKQARLTKTVCLSKSR